MSTEKYRENWNTVFRRTPGQIAKEALFQLENNLAMGDSAKQRYLDNCLAIFNWERRTG